MGRKVRNKNKQKLKPKLSAEMHSAETHLFEGKQLWLCLLIVVCVTFVAYIPSLSNGFTGWDDPAHLTENPVIRHLNLEHIQQMFFSADRTVLKTYIPMTLLTFAVEYKYFGYEPFIYHFTNLLLHLITTGLIVYFVFQLGFSFWAALGAALLFGVHPMHVESVAWVTERKDVLYAAFYMLSLTCFVRHLKTEKLPSYLFALLFGLLSILSKAMALSLPLILILTEWFYRKDIKEIKLLNKIPFFLTIVPVAFVTYQLNARGVEVEAFQGMLVWIWSFSFYLFKFIFPIHLLPLYDASLPISLSNISYLSALAVVFLTIGLLIKFRRNRFFVFAMGYFFLSIFFLLRFDIGNDLSIVADRFMYLPSLGICVLFGVGVQKLISMSEGKVWVQIAVQSSLVILMVFLSVQTFQQTRIWQNGITLWNYVIKAQPTNFRAYHNRGIDLSERKEFDLALADFNKTIEINPDYAKAYTNRSALYKLRGELDKALADYNQAIRLDADIEATYNNRGMFYFEQGQYGLALNDYNKSIALYPEFEEAYNNRGLVYAALGQIDNALKDYQTALKLNPKLFSAFSNRGMLLKNQGKFKVALENYNQAIQLNPQYSIALNNRGILYAVMERYDLSIEDFNRAIEVDPNYAHAYHNRGMSYKKQGMYQKAMNDYNHAIELDSQYVQAYSNRGVVKKALGKFEEALADYNMAINLDPKSGTIYFNRALLLRATGEGTIALNDFKKAQSLGINQAEQFIKEFENLTN